jgi:hypothetical protein
MKTFKNPSLFLLTLFAMSGLSVLAGAQAPSLERIPPPALTNRFKEDRPLVLGCMNALRKPSSIGVPPQSFFDSITQAIRKTFFDKSRPHFIEIESADYFPEDAFEDIVQEITEKQKGEHLRFNVIDGTKPDKIDSASAIILKAIMDKVAHAVELGLADENTLFAPLREEIRVHGPGHNNQAGGWHADGEFYTALLTVRGAATVIKVDGKDYVAKRGNIVIMTGNQRNMWVPERNHPPVHRAAYDQEIVAASKDGGPRIVYVRQVVKIY